MRSRQGFTLLELLMVVVIIGISSSLAVKSYQRAVECNTFRLAVGTLRAIVDAEKQHLLEEGVFTRDFNHLAMDNPNGRQQDTGVDYRLNVVFGAESEELRVNAIWRGRKLQLQYHATENQDADPPGETLILGPGRLNWCDMVR